MKGRLLANALYESHVVEPPRKRVMASMFADVDALHTQMEFVRAHVAELKAQGGQERKLRYSVGLYDLLREMHTKLKEHRAVRLEFWGQP
jgi:hypothetical protein